MPLVELEPAHVGHGAGEALWTRLGGVAELGVGRLEQRHQVAKVLRRVEPEVVQHVAEVVCGKDGGKERWEDE